VIVTSAKIDCSQINDWESFHDVFFRVFELPAFYGRNMDAWIDCMTSLDEPEEALSGIHCASGQVLTLELENVSEFRDRCPEQYSSLIDCAAFVNWRRVNRGAPSILALSFYA
jgi:hypothetical protein